MQGGGIYFAALRNRRSLSLSKRPPTGHFDIGNFVAALSDRLQSKYHRPALNEDGKELRNAVAALLL
jgi:hypothetical protein